MKNIFAMDITSGKEGTWDGKQFITRRVSKDFLADQDKLLEEISRAAKKADFPVVLSVISILIWFPAFIIWAWFLRAGGSLQEKYQKAPSLFYLGIFVVILALVLTLYERSREKKATDTGWLDPFTDHFNHIRNMAKNELEIPEHSVPIDVLGYTYIRKNSRMKIKNPLDVTFINYEYVIYKRNNALCFSNYMEEVAVPDTSIKSVEEVRQTAILDCWNKEESFQSPEYKKYQITADDMDRIRICSYFQIRIQAFSEEYEILIPDYEIDKMKPLLPERVARSIRH